MNCAQCRAAIEDDSSFCRYCGAAQAQATPAVDAAVIDVAAGRQSGAKGLSNGTIASLIAGAVGVTILFSALSGTSDEKAPDDVRLIANPSEADDAIVDAAAAASDATAAAEAAASAAAGEAADSGSWSYSTDEDKIRGATTYYATATSINSIYQAPPYDASTTMNITIRKSSAHGTDVMLTISSGQMMCPSYEGCSGTVRFDDGSAQRVSFNGPADNSSDTVFVVGAKSFIAKLKKAKRIVIEKTLYQAGNPQFEFNVSGLTWDQ